ncbi:hypothetical protein SCA6_000383 [Theobroma cacao]
MSNVDNRDSSEILRDFGGLNASATRRRPSLHVMLGSKITLLENAFGEVFHDIITMSADRSNALLVVLVLILTATYQAALAPPARFSGADTGSDSANNTSTDSTVGKSVMGSTAFLLFYIPNIIAFIIAMILILGLLAIVASGITTLLLVPLLLLYFCLLISTYDMSPASGRIVLWFCFLISLPVALRVIDQIKRLGKHLTQKEIPPP